MSWAKSMRPVARDCYLHPDFCLAESRRQMLANRRGREAEATTGAVPTAEAPTTSVAGPVATTTTTTTTTPTKTDAHAHPQACSEQALHCVGRRLGGIEHLNPGARTRIDRRTRARKKDDDSRPEGARAECVCGWTSAGQCIMAFASSQAAATSTSRTGAARLNRRGPIQDAPRQISTRAEPSCRSASLQVNLQDKSYGHT